MRRDRYTRNHPDLQSSASKLLGLLLELPMTGKWFTAQYPLCAAFWCIIFKPTDADICYRALRSIWTGRPTVNTLSYSGDLRTSYTNFSQNISRALDVAVAIRKWQDEMISAHHQIKAFWFQDMLQTLKVYNLSLG